MVELRYSEIRDAKLKGSEALRERLNQGDIKAISETLGIEYQVVYAVIVGKYFGKKEIVECAERIASFYDSVNFKETVAQILESYGQTVDAH